MPKGTGPLIIVGDSAFAEVAYEYFTHDSGYDVVGFTVNADYLKRTELLGLPVVPLEELEQHFDPGQHSFFAAITYVELNRLRRRLYETVKAKGFRPASYVSSNAFVWQNVQLGEHCFIMENNVVQPFVEIGDNVVLWSGNHIGHHSKIGANCFFSSHVVLSGFCKVGANSFMGVNATVANNIIIAEDCWVGPSALIAKDTERGELFSVDRSEPSRVSALRYFRIKDGQ